MLLGLILRLRTVAFDSVGDANVAYATSQFRHKMVSNYWLVEKVGVAPPHETQQPHLVHLSLKLPQLQLGASYQPCLVV